LLGLGGLRVHSSHEDRKDVELKLVKDGW
jgi:hypothetical protein